MAGVISPFASNVTSASIVPPLDLQSSTPAAPLFGAGETGDTVNRVQLQANGALAFGPGGSTAPDTTLTRLAATVLQTSGALLVSGAIDATVAGQGLKVAEGSNAKQGTATLAAGTVVVANTSVTATSRIFLTCQSLGTVSAPSALCVSARTAGTSFTILASQGTDTSVIAYEIFEPG